MFYFGTNINKKNLIKIAKSIVKVHTHIIILYNVGNIYNYIIFSVAEFMEKNKLNKTTNLSK